MPSHRVSDDGKTLTLHKLKCASAFYVVFRPVGDSKTEVTK